MSPAQKTFRMVAASFVAGAGAMALVGIVGPVAVKGGLSMGDAMATTAAAEAPAIAPLDIERVHAQLADADRSMAAVRATTDHAMQRLEVLSGK